MLDSMTHERMVVSTDGNAGPYIMVPLDQLERVKELLGAAGVSYWVDAHAIGLNEQPALAVINLGRGADVEQIQQLLDAAM